MKKQTVFLLDKKDSNTIRNALTRELSFLKTVETAKLDEKQRKLYHSEVSRITQMIATLEERKLKKTDFEISS